MKRGPLDPKQQRGLFVIFAVLLFIAASQLVLNAFRDNIVYFYTPTELRARNPAGVVRMGGLVEMNTLQRLDDSIVTFMVTDGSTRIPVRYGGALPSLFREGQGVVAEGALNADGVFTAVTLLAKHDEKYMPPEVAQRLKSSGVWRGEP